MARRIFVSYARRDRRLVETLVGDLRGSGHDPFFDEGLAGGQSWWDELLRNIEECDVFIPALTSEYLGSEPCRLECEYAAGLDRPFLPVRLEAVSPRLCSPRIAEAQWVAYDPTERATILDLMRGLNGLRPAPSLPDLRPARPAVPISYLTDLKSRVDSPAEMSRNDQVTLLADLKARLGGDERSDVRLLLERLRRRPDLGFYVATDIDALLAGGPAPSNQSAGAPGPGPTSSSASFQSGAGYPGGHGAAPGQAPGYAAAGYGQAPGNSQTQGYGQPQGARYQPPPPPPPPPNTGYQARPQYQPRIDGNRPPSYMLWTVLTTVLLCLPVGAIGIYFSSQVDKKYFAADIAGAQLASKRAKNSAIIAGVVGVVFILLFLALALGASNSNTPSGT